MVYTTMKTRTRAFLCCMFVLFFIVSLLVVLLNKNWSLKVVSVDSTSLRAFTQLTSVLVLSSSDSSIKTRSNTSSRSVRIDLSSGRDVLVYVHIQKTGGSHFLRHMVSATNGTRQLCYKPTQDLKKKLKKKRDIVFCPISSSTNITNNVPEMWLVSEKTYGWVCGLHPFLIEMKKCVGKFLRESYGDKQREFHYISVIRHPIVRYISEFLHVQRGATWTYGHICNGISMGREVMAPCYPGYYAGRMWYNVTLNEFMACSTNWANNRQTLMLADLETVNCLAKDTGLTQDEKEQHLLESAKNNLGKLEFFAVSEYMVESGKLFEHHFSLKLANPPIQKKLQFLHSKHILYKIWKNPHLYRRITRINRLDLELYQHALQLFEQRLHHINVNIDRNKLDKEVFALQDTVNRL